MSYLYDEYLHDHIEGVQKAYGWLVEHHLVPADSFIQDLDEHDASKRGPKEYEAYDRYFYGGNKSFKVVRDFNYAWLHHIHHNPHHWQYWVLQHDDEPEEALEMPKQRVIEMICDWWSFSWKSGNLYEIFEWYEKHKNMKLHEKTRKMVEDILEKMYEILEEENHLEHHGIKGQKWGVKNGPPYPLDDKTASKVRMHYSKERGNDAEYYKGQRTKKAIEANAEESLEELKRFDANHVITSEERERINHPNDDYGDTGRAYNCQNCTAAFELMERGYDVCARPMPTFSNVGDITKWYKNGQLSDLDFETDVTKWKLSDDSKEDIQVFTEDAKTYYSMYGKPPYSFDLDSNGQLKLKESFINGYKMDNGQNEATTKLYNTLSSQGNGSRGVIIIGFIDGQWYDKRSNVYSYHAINYKNENGNLVVYDPQSYRNCTGNIATKNYIPGLRNFDPRSLFYMRTDNLELDKSIASAVYSSKKG